MDIMLSCCHVGSLRAQNALWISVHYTLYTILYTLYTILYTLYSILYTLYTIHYTLYTIHYTLYTIHYTLYTVNCSLYTRGTLFPKYDEISSSSLICHRHRHRHRLSAVSLRLTAGSDRQPGGWSAPATLDNPVGVASTTTTTKLKLFLT